MKLASKREINAHVDFNALNARHDFPSIFKHERKIKSLHTEEIDNFFQDFKRYSKS